jgi:molecular chaperone GrpE
VLKPENDEREMSKADETKRPADAEAVDENARPEKATATDDMATLTGALDELRDKYLRAAAEADNIRKRAERDVAEARAYGIAGFAREIIGVSDNLSRALEAIEPQARTSAQGTLKALLDGVELTRRELEKALKKHGVRSLDPKGEKFDPHFHQAMYEVPDSDVPSGTVVQVMQTGYAIGERVLRPALVAIAKGGQKATQDQASSSDGGSD